MTPVQVKEYCIAMRRVTINQLSDHFSMDQSLARALLDFWIRRQRIRVVSDGCPLCVSRCAEELTYEWKAA